MSCKDAHAEEGMVLDWAKVREVGELFLEG